MPLTDIYSERERAFNLELKVKIEVSEENLSIHSEITQMQTLSGKALSAYDPFIQEDGLCTCAGI